MEPPLLPSLPRELADESPCDPPLLGEGNPGEGRLGDGMPVLGIPPPVLGIEEPGELDPGEGMLEELPPDEPPGIDGMPLPCEPD